ncbi:MAG TPA: DUF2520 domain-containing protein [Pricia antarctica]|uniref:DUF2520 domain-containing protein n=2 Tax=root TaxID=1 RepID=A0A831QN10_9FLAO|nr:DUF2520 domain-containing protein [Pricia antarctica]
MIRVSILGTGNVAMHLRQLFLELKDVEVVQIVGRNTKILQSLEERTAITSNFEDILDADIFIIAVNDDAIAKVSQFLKDKKGLVVHTSGSVSMDTLSQCKRYGVFYPVQTFSKHRKVDFKSVPICVEAQDDRDVLLLETLANKVSDAVYQVNSKQRKALHLGAVFVNNFTNHLFHIGQQICEENELPTAILQPLIQETSAKITNLSPYDAQTGPARRGDFKTIEDHLEQLNGSEFQDVYATMSASIEKLYR